MTSTRNDEVVADIENATTTVDELQAKPEPDEKDASPRIRSQGDAGRTEVDN